MEQIEDSASFERHPKPHISAGRWTLVKKTPNSGPWSGLATDLAAGIIACSFGRIFHGPSTNQACSLGLVSKRGLGRSGRLCYRCKVWKGRSRAQDPVRMSREALYRMQGPQCEQVKLVDRGSEAKPTSNRLVSAYRSSRHDSWRSVGLETASEVAFVAFQQKANTAFA